MKLFLATYPFLVEDSGRRRVEWLRSLVTQQKEEDAQRDLKRAWEHIQYYGT